MKGELAASSLIWDRWCCFAFSIHANGTCDVRAAVMFSFITWCAGFIISLLWVFAAHPLQMSACAGWARWRSAVLYDNVRWWCTRVEYAGLCDRMWDDSRPCCPACRRMLSCSEYSLFVLPHGRGVSVAPSWGRVGCEPCYVSPVVPRVEWLLSLLWDWPNRSDIALSHWMLSLFYFHPFLVSLYYCSEDAAK